LGNLQNILVNAQRCLDCADPRCVNLCPEHVDVQKAMSFILNRPGIRRVAWTQREDEAIASAMSAIKASFE